MRIFCQYSIAGYKVFQLTSLPHSLGEMKYVRMKEVNDAQSSDNQQIMITRKCDCNLDYKITSLFSSHKVSLMLLHHAGINKNDTVLYVNDIETRTNFAFVAQSEDEIELLARLTCVWVGEKHDILVNQLSSLVGKVVVDSEPVFAFYVEHWNQIKEDLLTLSIQDVLFDRIISGKNVLSNLVVNKQSILDLAKINVPLSSFICIPGNETIAEIERKRKIVKYSVIGLSTIAVIGLLAYLLND